jgi:LPXTG-motif cell wall-anchored protein
VIAPAPEKTPVAAPQTPPAQLPKTASPLPLLALVGIGSLCLAGLLRRLSLKRA